ncbi:MAG: flavodoxin family protein [Flavobacteriales bacterium]|nr:flavodoxin family protein [Flavobacteriales bacterium]
MKVLLINGSPHPHGCTYTALKEIADELGKRNIDTEIFHTGNKPVMSCMACGKCKATHRCIYDNDVVNTMIEKAEKADGFIFGSPVHYAAPSGMITAVLGRAFYAARPAFTYKPAASVVSARRAGTTAAYDQLNKFIGITEMLMVPSQYWNMVHGMTPEDVKKDEEGLQIMRTLGRNMAWMLNILDLAKKNGVETPCEEPRQSTNFIR